MRRRTSCSLLVSTSNPPLVVSYRVRETIEAEKAINNLGLRFFLHPSESSENCEEYPTQEEQPRSVPVADAGFKIVKVGVCVVDNSVEDHDD